MFVGGSVSLRPIEHIFVDYGGRGDAESVAAKVDRISENIGDSGLVPNPATFRSRNTTGCQLPYQSVHPHVPIYIQGKDEPYNFGPFRIHCQAVTLFVVVVAEGRRTRWPLSLRDKPIVSGLGIL
jgi:hypothetical protein